MSCRVGNYPGIGLLETPNGIVAYTYGPDITGQTMSSGQYFMNQWGALLSNSNIIIQNLGEPWKYLPKNSTGLSIGWLGNSSDLLNHYSNLSFCFNNSGSPVFSLQNNTKIYVLESTSTGISSTSWLGQSPAILNTLLVNPPPNIPDYLYPQYETGTLFCFYQKSGSLFYRTKENNWTGEYLVLTGLLDSQIFETRTRVDFIDRPLTLDRPPYRFIIANPSLSEDKLRVVASKKYINYTFEDFSEYQTGMINNLGSTGDLSNGYGGRAYGGVLCPLLVYASNVDTFAYDAFTGYATGINQTEFKNANHYLPFFNTGWEFSQKGDIYFYDDLAGYPTGKRDTFSLGHYISGYISGDLTYRTFIEETFQYDSFTGYSIGSIRLFRRGTYIKCPQQIAKVIR